MTQPTITRRSFVKSAAALGAACGLGVAVSDDLVNVDPAHADTGGDVKIVKTACRACIASCAVLAHVKNGRVIKIEGNPESPMSQGGLCAKAMAALAPGRPEEPTSELQSLLLISYAVLYLKKKKKQRML